MHICEIQKNGTDEPICKAEIETDVENKCMDTKGGKAGWVGGCGGGVNQEIGIDIYTLICIIQITNKNLLYKKVNKIKFRKKNKQTRNVLTVLKWKNNKSENDLRCIFSFILMVDYGFI